MIKKIKKHKNKLFILMLTLISALTLFLNVGKTYAYTYDETTNTITSDNLLNLNNKTSIQNGIEFTSNNGIITANGTTNSRSQIYWQLDKTIFRIDKVFTLNLIRETTIENLTCFIRYTYSDNTTGYQDLGMQSKSTYTIRKDVIEALFYIDVNRTSTVNYTVNNYKFYPMLVEGTNQAIKFEPYGTFINETLYNDLQNDYTTLENNYDTLQDNYDTLEDNYNTLNGNINNLNEFYKYGFIGFMKNGYISNNNVYSSRVTLYYTNNDTNTISIKEYPLTLNDISSYYGNNTLSLYDLINNYIDLLKNSIEDFTDLYFINECNLFIELQSLYNIEYIDFTNVDFTSNMELFIRNSVDNIGVYFNDLASTNVNINSTLIQEKNINLKQFNTIEFDRISFDSDVYKPSITLNNVATSYYSNGFNNGYQSGLQQAYSSQQVIIDDLNNQINSLNSQVADLQGTIALVQSSNEQLRNELSTLNENNMTWQKMFFTMADTPLKTVASVLGKDSGNAFLGINLYQTFIGLLTTLAIIWLIKRIL